MPTTMRRAMEIVTPLGEDVLFHSLHGREELGRLSEFEIELLSLKKDIDLNAILGAPITVRVAQPDESRRYFSGYVTRIAQGGQYGRFHRYSASVRPWLWFLTRTSDCRIFQDMTVPDIIASVFADHPTADFALELTNNYRTWPYCVQYRETDFNFVSRLMEEEGIYYYIRHTDGHDTLVLTDSTSKHAPAPGYERLSFISAEEVVRPELEHISSWDVQREIQPGVYVHNDYDLERPSVELRTRRALPRGYERSDYEIYDYPGHYVQKADGEHYASVRIDEFGSQFETGRAATNARGVCVGALFGLEDHPRDDQNREHLIISATYHARFGEYEAMPAQAGGSEYRCSYVAMPSAQQFRPRRTTPKPFVQGPQTAVVVGPAGEQIYTDEYGRVKVHFHWDRYGQRDENSSCWIRVSSPWAGKGWGAVSTPRIGQEVIVDFLEGDPDQPIITGRVYNAELQPPFGFPAGAVISGIKSDTHKGVGYNEMSMDDTAGKERVFLHGQYNMDTVVEHDQTSTIHNNRTDQVDVDDSETIGNNQTWTVGVNRSATIGSNETLTVGANRTKSVGANEAVNIGANRTATVGANETVAVGRIRVHTVGVNEAIKVGAMQAITVGGAQNTKVGAAQSTMVGGAQSTTVGGARTVTVKGVQAVTVGLASAHTVGAGYALSVGGAMNTAVGLASFEQVGLMKQVNVGRTLKLEAGDSIELVCGASVLVLKKDGTVTLNGKDISVDGTGKIAMKADGDVVVKGSKVGIN